MHKVPQESVLSEDFVLSFRSKLIDWFHLNGRDLPWRRTKDPYKIWVSEIILQQTQVVQGRAYYERFISELPNVEALANVSEDRLLMLWQGLGYYSRAHNLKYSAQKIMTEYGGIFPNTPEGVRSLKGVGPYTTAAIMSIAYDYPLAVIDGNVYRVLSRLLASDAPIDTTEGKRYYEEQADRFLDKSSPSDYNQAIMDLGAVVCTPRNPLCHSCPVQSLCQSYGTDLVELLPRKEKRTQVAQRYMYFYLYLHDDSFAVERREKKGIWKGLYQLPLFVSNSAKTAPSPPLEGWTVVDELVLPDHRLSHRLLHIKVLVCYSEPPVDTSSHNYEWIHTADHKEYAFPKPLRAFLDRYFAPSSPSLFDDEERL